jgi:HlyD family secretion protein
LNRKWKILLIILLVVLISGGVFASIKLNERGVVVVQTGKVVRQDLVATVTASGEIKPKNYINLGANAQGPIAAIYVKEGDRVHRGQVLASIENTQAASDVVAQKAAINSALADSAASEENMRSMADGVENAKATLERNRAELERTKFNMERYEQLFKDKLVARQDYDQKKAEYNTAIAAMKEAETRIQQLQAQQAQSRAQLASNQRRVSQLQANLPRYSDVLAKHQVISPIDGVVTDLPMRVGEIVVPGIQSSPSSTIMTVAEMAVITAELRVDETDIVNIKLDQLADVTIDAIPNKTFKGRVTEIGNTALVRSSGVAASQSTTSSQEAKDFKVVIALDNPPPDIRPGLSCTGKVVTATRRNVLSVPIQALTIRTRADLEPLNKNVQAAAKFNPAEEKARKEELQGVFVIRNGKAVFQKVDTGISGPTDMEVLDGVQENDQIIVGSYKVIRTLRNDTRIKIDNKPQVKTEA